MAAQALCVAAAPARRPPAALRLPCTTDHHATLASHR